MDDDQANNYVCFKLLKLIRLRDTLKVASAFKQMKKVLQSHHLVISTLLRYLKTYAHQRMHNSVALLGW